MKQQSSILFILLGITLILFEILIYDKVLSSYLVAVKLLGHIGIGFFILGLVSIIFETKHWVDYIKSKLSEIVVEKKYLENYTLDQLINLQTEVLKVYFKNEEIAGPEGFLNHYQNHIQSIIACPYRKDIQAHLILEIKYMPAESFKVKEKLYWTCKSVSGKIIDEVKWVSQIKELDELSINYLMLEHDGISPSYSKFSKRIEGTDLIANYKAPTDFEGFVFPLNEYASLDGLKITISAEYTIPIHRMIAWKMTHATKGVSITLKFPEHFSVLKEVYCPNHQTQNLTEYKGYFSWETDSWVMPDEGLSLQLIKDI